MKLILTLHRRKLSSLGASRYSRRKVTQPLVAAACSLRPGGKWRRSERIQRKERRARSSTRAPAPRTSDSVNLGLAGNGPTLILHGPETLQSKSVTWASFFFEKNLGFILAMLISI